MPFLIGMMNALMTSAARSGAEISWDDIARNFKPAAGSPQHKAQQQQQQQQVQDKGKGKMGPGQLEAPEQTQAQAQVAK